MERMTQLFFAAGKRVRRLGAISLNGARTTLIQRDVSEKTGTASPAPAPLPEPREASRLALPDEGAAPTSRPAISRIVGRTFVCDTHSVTTVPAGILSGQVSIQGVRITSLYIAPARVQTTRGPTALRRGPTIR